ncbi:MAG: hypothetical protein F4124_09845 [Acidimicrobiia bacterium]|nr:hypothetical protein [Acidimicrobiia bacterium]MYB72355.1 hypothetical protein [Acidimicrobiia bacterium]MYH99718.1 hypothetical protein [Acidimicrobiia bacterium]
MDIGGDQLGVLLGHVAPIEQYAIRIAEAHSLGHGPGGQTDVWGVEFQRKAHKVWKETLPPQFLRQVAYSYERCAWLMASFLLDEMIIGDWENIARYLAAVAAAIAEDPDCAEQETPPDPLGIGQMPEAIHYEKLAELMSIDAAERLRATAGVVALHCRLKSPAAPNEVQLASLQGLANGEKHAELAKRLGYSERHLQRILADMWRQFGLDNATEGVAFAVAEGWVTVPRNVAR